MKERKNMKIIETIQEIAVSRQGAHPATEIPVAIAGKILTGSIVVRIDRMCFLRALTDPAANSLSLNNTMQTLCILESVKINVNFCVADDFRHAEASCERSEIHGNNK